MEKYEITVRRKSSNAVGVVTFIIIMVILGIVVAFGGDGGKQQSPPVVPTYPEQVNVTDLRVVGTKYHAYVSDGQETGPSGKLYSGPSFSMQSTYMSMEDEGEKWPESSISFATDGHYGTLSGTFFAEAQKADANLNVVFRIYADGTPIYESAPMNTKTVEVSFSVNIDNASVIEFSAQGDEESNRGLAGLQGGVTVTVFDAKVSQ